MKKLLLACFAFVLLSAPLATQAQTYPHCRALPADTCSEADCGPIMCGISEACQKNGTCSVGDILRVFDNVGNLVFALVGAVVLLMYIIGGIYLLSAAGNSDRISTGKNYIKTSTIGLVIVLLGVAGIKTLETVLTEEGRLDPGVYATCTPGNPNGAGEVCGAGKVCNEEGLCVTECEWNHPPSAQLGDPEYLCIDVNNPDPWTVISCERGLCPGAASIQCCQVTGY